MNERMVFIVPDLVPFPVLGAGCCAVASAWLVEDVIGQLPGVHEVRADDERGEVSVCFDPVRITARQIAEHLEELGFVPTGIARPEQEPALKGPGTLAALKTVLEQAPLGQEANE